ncbi:thioredoxin domain-containing protein [Schumannella luteola]|uniref:Spermatogenesis-associated protein 20-like TRX domain-containing protein n=1 Tax=Schumannella luteola TaxID=472059 RepID=A0A852YDD3_9MICO|nr:DUF255 domain-containing protein [Schumannella luteola]NYG99294.1 hypothetical protein [Schumannella luteola]TPX06030.1 thioredoxin domain-containing protein [Schumannella luteola]
MAGDRLADALSPYLRAHAANPVDWWPWGEEAFAEAERRDVPVLVSIGYSTCHWCHVMARESFSDPEVAAVLRDSFVAIKVDREEHPEVDATYLAAASAFTPQLGWPLTVFTTPRGRVFYAGTYFPPEPRSGVPAFRQVLGAVAEAFRERRAEVETSAAAVAEAVRASVPETAGTADGSQLAAAAAALAAHEDTAFGGFGGAPKFPVAPVLLFLDGRADAGDTAAVELARRALHAMAASPLRDPIEGGFFRYAVQRDWSEPHYERMLTDNALLLDLAARLAVDGGGGEGGVGAEDSVAREVAEGVAGFLLDVLRRPDGRFGAAQDSESDVDGVRSEGGYYSRDAAGRALLVPPAIDDKAVTGWNGLAIGALAEAGLRLGRPEWIRAAREAADAVLRGATDERGVLRRAAAGATVSDAVATLEDAGLLAGGLLRLAGALAAVPALDAEAETDTGAGAASAADPARYLARAREELARCVRDGVIVPPYGADPVLAERGLDLALDLGEGAAPSGRSAVADAVLRLYALTGEAEHARLAESALAPAVRPALEGPISFGAALHALDRLSRPLAQLVIVLPAAPSDDDRALLASARRWRSRGGALVVVAEHDVARLAELGFELFAARALRDGRATAYLCEHFACALPVTTAAELDALLGR